MNKRDYYLWLAGTTADQFANSMRSLVLPIIVVAITGSVTAAGGLETASKIVFVVLALFGGVLTDRINRRTGMLLRAGLGFVVWLAATVLLATGTLTYPVLFALVIIAAITEAMFGFADDAALRSIVTEDQAFASAQSVIQARRAVINLLGGPVGGLLYAAFAWLPFGVTAGALALLGACALMFHTDLRLSAAQEAAEAAGETEVGQAGEVAAEEVAGEKGAEENSGASRPAQGIAGVFSNIAAGFKLVFFDAVKRPIAIASALMGFATTLIMTLVVYQLIQAHYTAFQISLVEVAAAIGMFIGAPLSGIAVQKLPTGRLVIAVLTAMALTFLGLALVPTYYFMFLWFSLYGLCMPLVSAPMLGYFYARTPPEMQGRSAAIMTVAGMGIGSFAPLASGALAAGGSYATGYYLAAGLMGLCALLFAASTKVRAIGRPETWAEN